MRRHLAYHVTDYMCFVIWNVYGIWDMKCLWNMWYEMYMEYVIWNVYEYVIWNVHGIWNLKCKTSPVYVLCSMICNRSSSHYIFLMYCNIIYMNYGIWKIRRHLYMMSERECCVWCVCVWNVWRHLYMISGVKCICNI